MVSKDSLRIKINLSYPQHLYDRKLILGLNLGNRQFRPIVVKHNLAVI